MHKLGSPGTRHLRARPFWGLASFVVGLTLFFASNLSGVPAALARPLDDVIASGVLRVVVYEFNPPYSWTDETSNVRGIDADIARAIADKMGLKAEIIARIAGEEVDDDLRSNIWQGPRTGGLVGDVMMHVPMEKAFIARNTQVGISNAYHHEKVVLAVHPDMVDVRAGLGAFRNAKIAVQFATAAHYYVMFADEGAYKANVNPYRKFSGAVTSFLARENAGLLGPRSEVEAALKDEESEVQIIAPQYDTELRMAWTIGMAVREDSRDTGYAVGKALREIEASGELDAIFVKYGVTRVPPPVP